MSLLVFAKWLLNTKVRTMGKTNKKNSRGDFSQHEQRRQRKQKREGKPRDEKRALRDTFKEYQ
jgi:hypothetical protein